MNLVRENSMVMPIRARFRRPPKFAGELWAALPTSADRSSSASQGLAAVTHPW